MFLTVRCRCCYVIAHVPGYVYVYYVAPFSAFDCRVVVTRFVAFVYVAVAPRYVVDCCSRFTVVTPYVCLR